MSDKWLCIWHGGCLDGFAAAYCVRNFLGEENVEFFAGVYQKDPPDVTGRNVIIVDFSYKRAVIEDMTEKAKSILILDHHKTAEEDLAGFGVPPRWKTWRGLQEEIDTRLSQNVRTVALFDMNRSGTGLAWDYFSEGAQRPDVISRIEDRDLWRFRYHDTKQINAALYARDFDFEASWLHVFLTDRGTLSYNTLHAEGCALLVAHEKNVKSLCKLARPVVIAGTTVPTVNCNALFASDVGNELAKTAPFSATYYDATDGTIFSLRSVEGGYDVSEIAKKFGGGGHKHASGFRADARQFWGELDLSEATEGKES